MCIWRFWLNLCCLQWARKAAYKVVIITFLVTYLKYSSTKNLCFLNKYVKGSMQCRIMIRYDKAFQWCTTISSEWEPCFIFKEASIMLIKHSWIHLVIFFFSNIAKTFQEPQKYWTYSLLSYLLTVLLFMKQGQGTYQTHTNLPELVLAPQLPLTAPARDIRAGLYPFWGVWLCRLLAVPITQHVLLPPHPLPGTETRHESEWTNQVNVKSFSNTPTGNWWYLLCPGEYRKILDPIHCLWAPPCTHGYSL